MQTTFIRPVATWIAMATLAATLTACSPDESYGSFAIDLPRPELDTCVREAFPLNLSLFGAKDTEDATWLTMRPTDQLEFVDLVTVRIPDVLNVSERLDTALQLDTRIINSDAVAPVEASEAQPRVELSVIGSCRDAGARTLLVSGAVTFTDYGSEIGDVIDGNLTDTLLLDARTGDIVAERITGNWHIVVRRGPPYNDFVFGEP